MWRRYLLAATLDLVDVSASLSTTVSPERVFAWVDDLGRYPEWLDIVTRAEPVGDVDSPQPVWSIDLRGSVGPLARSKRLRMVRTLHDPDHRVAFERREIDGRDHATWRMIATVTPEDEGSKLLISLHYDGRFGGRPLEMLLEREINGSRHRLSELLASEPS